MWPTDSSPHPIYEIVTLITGGEGGNKGEPREASQMTTESGIKAL